LTSFWAGNSPTIGPGVHKVSSFTTKLTCTRLSVRMKHPACVQILTGVHLSGQDVHRHLVPLRSLDCQPLLRRRAHRWRTSLRLDSFFFEPSPVICLKALAPSKRSKVTHRGGKLLGRRLRVLHRRVERLATRSGLWSQTAPAWETKSEIQSSVCDCC